MDEMNAPETETDAREPFLIASLRRNPSGDIRHNPVGGGALGTSARGFLAELDAYVAERVRAVEGERDAAMAETDASGWEALLSSHHWGDDTAAVGRVAMQCGCGWTGSDAASRIYALRARHDRHRAEVIATTARERMRVVEGERDAARAQIRDREANGAEKRAESAEAAHEAEKAAHDRLRAEFSELADDFASNVDWSAGRGNYGDNEAWERAAREVRALLGGGGAR